MTKQAAPIPRTDPYPTRSQSGATAVIARAHPVVYGSADDGPLSARALDAFDTDGFARIDTAITPTAVETMFADVIRIRDDLAAAGDARVVRQRDTGEVRSIFAVHECPPIRRAILDSGLAHHARQILGSPVYVHQTRVNFKRGFGSGDFYWHSDFETWHAEDGLPQPRAVTVALALTANHSFNGPLLMVPGSHRVFIPCSGVTPDNFHEESLSNLRPSTGVPSEGQVAELIERHGIFECTMPAGAAVIFDANVLHGSGNNITSLPRITLFVVFNSLENLPQPPFAAVDRRPQYLASRDYLPI